MSWPDADRRLLLSTPRLGPQAIERLERAGIRSLGELRAVGASVAVERVCGQLGSTAWRNRRQALERLCSAGKDEG